MVEHGRSAMSAGVDLTRSPPTSSTQVMWLPARTSTRCLREVGIIKSSPQKIIAEGTDWRFLNELKMELKA